VSGPGLLLRAWALVTIGLLVKVFAAGLVGRQQPPRLTVAPHRVDVNRAGVPELAVLPGVGRLRAERIVVERIRNGPFRDVADLARVDGFGPASVAALRDAVVVVDPDATTR
jgi:competence protein ComEA